MKAIVRIWILCLSLFLMMNVRAEVRIVIDEGIDSARPIAVVPFKWNGPGNAPVNIADIVAADLRNSGKFNPIPVSKMPQQPNSVGDINPEIWAALGIDAVVVGQITPIEGMFQISYQLIDTIGATGMAGAVLSQNQFSTNSKWLRWGAHAVSDETFEKLTGIKGAFRTRIAYVVQKHGSSKPYEIHFSDYDGFNQFTVYQSNQPLMSPAWSADGKQLAYVSFENKKSQLVVQDLASGSRKAVASFNGHNGAPAFSPDGEKLAFASSKDGMLNIYILNLRSGQISQLTKGAGNNTEPSWSADSQTILFTSDRSGLPQVYQMNAVGGDISLVSSGGPSYSGKMTADGNTIIMIRGDSLVKKDVASGHIEVLSSTFLDETPSISPNGMMVIYSSTQGLGKVLQLVSADGRFKARLPGNDGQVKFPAWSPYLTN